ncbi:MAG: ISAzo13 family transposase, partial [Myxococcales bacterium]|nr:ISAzo13 family transposase [Myxococcales bacterium]
SRGGKSRVPVRALDHDFVSSGKATPLGLLLPELDELSITVCTSKVTRDCIVDTLDHWWSVNEIRLPKIDTLVLLQDNGPENSGRRTQFLNRMVSFADRYQLNIRLAYYPPYHSKYNPVERCWGVLANHWNGALLDTLEAIVGYAKSMTSKKQNPVVRPVTKTYQLGVSLSKQAMKDVEHRLDRLAQLPAWFIDINWQPAA